MKEKIPIREFIDKFPFDLSFVDIDDSIFSNFIGWAKMSSDQLDLLEKIGEIRRTDSNNKLEDYVLNYWNEDSLINFESYPYSACDLYRLANATSFYLIYTEFGGHSPERRCRLIQRKLIDLSKIDDIYVHVM